MRRDMRFEVGAELREEGARRPRAAVRQRADTLAVHEVAALGQGHEVLLLTLAALDPRERFVEPAGAFAALRTLAARLVFEEARGDQRNPHHARAIIHDDRA